MAENSKEQSHLPAMMHGMIRGVVHQFAHRARVGHGRVERVFDAPVEIVVLEIGQEVAHLSLDLLQACARDSNVG